MSKIDFVSAIRGSVFIIGFGCTSIGVTTLILPPSAHAQSATGFTQRGNALVYSSQLAGRRTASGERYRPKALTAAHRTLPLGSVVRLTNVANGLTAIVRVNDRGPFVEGRIIDVSEAAGEQLGLESGYGYVELVLVEGPLDSETRAALNLDRADRPATSKTPDLMDRTRFTIQLASFSDVGAARRYAARIDGAWIHTVEVDQKTVYRVNHGAFDDREAAEAEAEALAERGFEGFVKTVEAAEIQAIVDQRP